MRYIGKLILEGRFFALRTLDKVAVAIDHARFSQDKWKIENGSKKTFAIITKSAKIANVVFREWFPMYTVATCTLAWLELPRAPERPRGGRGDYIIIITIDIEPV